MEKIELIQKQLEEKRIPNIKYVEVVKSGDYYIARIKYKNHITSEALFNGDGVQLTDFIADSSLTPLKNDYISIMYYDNLERTVVYQVIANELKIVAVCEKVDAPGILLNANAVLLRNYGKVKVLSLEDGQISREYQNIDYHHTEGHFPVGEAFIYLEERDNNGNREQTSIQGFVDHTGTPISWFMEDSSKATITYPFDKMTPYEIDEELDKVRNRLKKELSSKQNANSYGKKIYQKLREEMGFGDK